MQEINATLCDLVGQDVVGIIHLSTGTKTFSTTHRHDQESQGGASWYAAANLSRNQALIGDGRGG